MPVEIACDESGFTGGNLTVRHTVFSHASLRLPLDVARDEIDRLRRRVSARGELKASWLLRWCDDQDLHRLLHRDGLLRDQVRVHLSDTRLFLLTRLTDVLLGSEEVDGLDLPGQDATSREAALELHRHGDEVFGRERWQCFVVAAGQALHAPGRWVPASAVSDFEGELGRLAALPAPAAVRQVLRQLRTRAGRARGVRRAAEIDARRTPLVEPLLPALSHAVLAWGAQHRDLVVVHDEQSALTPWRMAAIGRRLDRTHAGHTVQVRRVDSRDDPRVQVADLVAGIARRAGASLLSGRPERRLIELVAPIVDPLSIWPDTSWVPDLSRERLPAWPRDGADRPSARPA